MSDYEKIRRIRGELKEVRDDLAARIGPGDATDTDLAALHQRVSKAIKVLSGEG